MSIWLLIGLFLIIMQLAGASGGGGRLFPRLRRPEGEPEPELDREPDSDRALVRRSWAQVAAELGLGIEESRSSYSLYGHMNDFDVAIEVHEASVEIRVQPDRPIDPALRITRRNVSDTRTAVITGDKGLDQATVIGGDRASILGKLDVPARELARRLIGDGPVSVSRGRVRAEMDVDLVSRDRVVDTVRGMIELGRRLTDDGELEDSMSANVRWDPEPGVRLENLRQLIAEFPDGKAIQAAWASAVQDPDAAVRSCAEAFRRSESPAMGGLSIVDGDSSRGAVSLDRSAGGLAALDPEKEDDSR